MPFSLVIKKEPVSNLPQRKAVEKENRPSVFIEPVKIDRRKSPRMEHPTLDLTNDFLFEAKLNKDFLRESYY